MILAKYPPTISPVYSSLPTIMCVFTTIRHWVTRQHTHPTRWGQWLLALPALGYRIGLWCWQWAWRVGVLRQTCLATPTISVGNLTTGGTGKTPVVIALAKHLASLGATVVVLSRGYGATETPNMDGLPIPSHPHHGDEPWLIQQAIAPLGGTVLVGPNRIHNARLAETHLHPDVFILDDGFQHQTLGRDVDIILVDSTTPIAHAALLPAGPYREPLSSLSRNVRPTWCWVTKGTAPQQQAAMHYLQQQGLQHHWGRAVTTAPIQPTEWQQPLTDNTPVQPIPEGLAQQPCVALSGLANNAAFATMLQAHGITLAHTLTYTDHHPYTAGDIATIVATADGLPIITTQKDWVKLAPHLAQAATPPTQWWVVTIAPQLPVDAITQWWHNRANKH